MLFLQKCSLSNLTVHNAGIINNHLYNKHKTNITKSITFSTTLEEPDWLGFRGFCMLFSLKISLSFDFNFSISKGTDTSELVVTVEKNVGDARGISGTKLELLEMS